MANTPPTHVFEPTQSIAAADPEDMAIIQLTFYTAEGLYSFRIPRSTAELLGREIMAALGGGGFPQTQVR